MTQKSSSVPTEVFFATATKFAGQLITDNVTFAVDEPAELVAVTVYSVEAKTAEGVPLITQVVLLMESPPGRAGEIVQLVIAAPFV